MRKILSTEKVLRISILNQQPAVLVYTVMCPILIFVFYVVTTFIM